MERRDFIKLTGLGSASLVATRTAVAAVLKPTEATIRIDPKPLFDLSPHL